MSGKNASSRQRTATGQGQSRQSDARGATRQQQLEQRRLERARRAKREQQRQRVRRFGFLGGGIVLAALVVLLVVRGVQQATTVKIITGTGTYTTSVSGETRDGMSCLGIEGTVVHIHMYLAIYVDGKQQQVPPDTGIVNGGSCYYPLHVHSDPGDDNIIHEESPDTSTYTLGAFFDVWGQPLSKTQVMSHKADAAHTLQFITFDGNGKKTVVTGNPLDIKFSEHETIAILYNSPNVNPQPFTQWVNGE